MKNIDNQNNLNIWLKSELAYTSNAIEGNTLTRKETVLAIEENITSKSKSINEYLEARNHGEAFEYILEILKNDNLIIDENVILKIHRNILNKIDDINAGFYRNVAVRVYGSDTIFPNPMKVPDLMNNFNQWLKENDDISILKAIKTHYKLVSIHPFVDGNGRTARLLMNLILLKNKYCPIIIRPIDRKRYITAIENYQTKDKSEEYFVFMLKRLINSFNTVINMLDVEKAICIEKPITISKFAKLHNLPISTIRYWVLIGKIKPASYTNSGYMLFDKNQKIDGSLARRM
jgi:Fic family protein